jgi:hypothetical protein
LLNNYIGNNCVSSSYMINNFNLKTLPYLGVKLLWNLRDLIILFWFNMKQLNSLYSWNCLFPKKNYFMFFKLFFSTTLMLVFKGSHFSFPILWIIVRKLVIYLQHYCFRYFFINNICHTKIQKGIFTFKTSNIIGWPKHLVITLQIHN